MSQLDKVKEIFLTEVDEETRAENLAKIKEWEQGLIENRAYASWQDQDITRQIARQAKETYVDIAIALSTNRALDQAARERMWAQQDACLFLLSITEKDAKSALKNIEREINTALRATN